MATKEDVYAQVEAKRTELGKAEAAHKAAQDAVTEAESGAAEAAHKAAAEAWERAHAHVDALKADREENGARVVAVRRELDLALAEAAKS